MKFQGLGFLKFFKKISKSIQRTFWHLLKLMSCLALNCAHHIISSKLKFIYSEKATKVCKISTLLLSTIHTMVEIPQNFVAFSEYMNFSNVKINLEIFLKLLWPSQNVWTWKGRNWFFFKLGGDQFLQPNILRRPFVLAKKEHLIKKGVYFVKFRVPFLTDFANVLLWAQDRFL